MATINLVGLIFDSFINVRDCIIIDNPLNPVKKDIKHSVIELTLLDMAFIPVVISIMPDITPVSNIVKLVLRLNILFRQLAIIINILEEFKSSMNSEKIDM